MGNEQDVKIVSFNLATSERGYTTAEGRQVPEKTTWHNLVIKNGLAPVAYKYLKKGSRVYVDGKIDNRSYEKDGATTHVIEIIVEKMEILSATKREDIQN
jgi:single-strand DNA-binding protein